MTKRPPVLPPQLVPAASIRAPYHLRIARPDLNLLRQEMNLLKTGFRVSHIKGRLSCCQTAVWCAALGTASPPAPGWGVAGGTAQSPRRHAICLRRDRLFSLELHLEKSWGKTVISRCSPRAKDGGPLLWAEPCPPRMHVRARALTPSEGDSQCLDRGDSVKRRPIGWGEPNLHLLMGLGHEFCPATAVE